MSNKAVSKKKDLNVGIVGYGFMGRTHSNAYLKAPRFFDVAYRPVLKAVCARNADRVKGFAENWGYESIETDWCALVARKDIDLIDIASPNDTHAEIAIAAARAGKMVLCEKPLGRTAEEAKAMVDAVEKAKVPNMVWYNYRRVPAVVLLKKLLDEDRFGRIFHYRSQFLQDWTISQDLPFYAAFKTDRWRCSKPPATLVAIRRSSLWRSTVSAPPLRGTYTTCTDSITSTIAMRGNSAAGRAFTSRTATILT